ncbi:MAG: 2-oxoacid:acceptor oxidoreductase subunit alpha [Verrucomicrobiota bacterium]|jgi:2-oxoglutarate ferredoxin oxidoreductase subunit alpha|nr:2-oxoacid:acceptor oxidoreductase subunit alpha [Verrucomicrobiota bacterium]MDP7050230.1 2-oxoacid:acceptor oxidoreductase subunit alpha [Verrucomicrobiota bacterium]
MSETTVSEANNGSDSQPSSISEVTIRLAGNSQDGIQSIGGFLARLAGRSEREVMTMMTIPSTISGGASIFQVRLGSGEVLSPGDKADVLFAFYQHSYDNHVNNLAKEGILVYDSDHVEPHEEWLTKYRHIGIAISSLTIEAIGGTARDKGKNIYALGLIGRMFSLNTEKLERLINERFSGKGESVVKTAMDAFQAGYRYHSDDLSNLFSLARGGAERSNQVVMSGNEAIGYGLIAAGVRFGAGYPITPWTDIMELLRRELPKYGGSFIQCEDEIASVSMAIGGSYGGRVAVTGSSGPGISLKTEAIGWAVMAEMPLVVIDIQRGGPSTGLPTDVEQSDLNIACYGGHGDSPRVVLAASDVEDCFYTAIEAVNIARKYSVPVFVLSDQAIATRIEAFNEPDLNTICNDIKLDLSPVPSHKPYDLSSGDGLSRHRAPGTRIEDGRYPVVTGLEHDESGHPSGDAVNHISMTKKRRNKLKTLADELPAPEIFGPESGDVLLVGWGSTRGPLLEAVEQLSNGGYTLSTMHMKHINPLPTGLEDILPRFKSVYIVEMNDGGVYGYGQLAGILRARYADARIKGINKTAARRWKVSEIIERVKARLEEEAAV